MRILFFSHYYSPEGNAPATRVSSLVNCWVKMGHEVQVVTCAPNHPYGRIYSEYSNSFPWRSECLDSVSVVRLWTLVAPNKGFVLRILNFLSYLAMSFIYSLRKLEYDVIIATTPQLFCGISGSIANHMQRIIWRKRIPFILEVRDLWPESILAVGAMKRGSMVKCLERLEKWLYAQGDILVTVGEGYRDEIIKRGVKQDKIEIIYNGYDISEVEQNVMDNGDRKDGELIVSYIGTVGMASGLEFLLEVDRFIRDDGVRGVTLKIVGGGAAWEDLDRRVRECGSEHVVLIGQVSKEEARKHTRESDVCIVHLRKNELFKTVLPSKIFEAFGNKKPVLVGVDGEARRLVEGCKGGLYFEPENARELYGRIVLLWQNKQMLDEMGENAYNYVREKHGWDVLSRRYIEVISRVLENT